MGAAQLHIRMLGELSLRCGAQEISDGDNRSKKVWLLLAYLICCKGRNVSQDELIRLLWSTEESSTNPANALKAVFHRLRSTLDQLDGVDGRALILRRDGGYVWNTSIPFVLDTEEFESLCKAGGEPENRLKKYQKALALYAGDFLPKLSSEPWVVPISAYYHNLYLQTAQDAAALLFSAGRYAESAEISRRAIELDAFDEALYQDLMRALLAEGDQSGAAALYRNMSEMLFSNFGVAPSDESKALYREAVRAVSGGELELGLLREQLRVPETGGALVCDYDFFKVLYQAQARAVSRSGDAVQLALLTVSGAAGKLPKRSLNTCMENLQRLTCTSLRRGDVLSRCSVSQLALLLLQTNYENACRVMDRIARAFARQYPHSPAVLRYSVQPLEPST